MKSFVVSGSLQILFHVKRRFFLPLPIFFILRTYFLQSYISHFHYSITGIKFEYFEYRILFSEDKCTFSLRITPCLCGAIKREYENFEILAKSKITNQLVSYINYYAAIGSEIALVVSTNHLKDTFSSIPKHLSQQPTQRQQEKGEERGKQSYKCLSLSQVSSGTQINTQTILSQPFLLDTDNQNS